MLTDQDIEKLISVLASKGDVQELKEDVYGLKESVQSLLVSTDALVKSVDDLGIEYGAISMQLDRHEKWIKQIAGKVGLELVVE